MNEPADTFADHIAQLEDGRPPEIAAAGLPPDDGEALLLAHTLRQIPIPARDPASIQAQRTALLRYARNNQKQPPPINQFNAIRGWLRRQPRITRFSFAALLPALLLIIALLIFNQLSGNRAPQVAEEAGSARKIENTLLPTQGMIELQKDGEWTAVTGTVNIKAGQNLRTGPFSRATLRFYDNSVVTIGPNAELQIDQLNIDGDDGPRVVQLTVLQGMTTHDVVPASDPNALYEIRTPDATSVAKGTVFSVAVFPAQQTRVTVTAGVVELSAQNVTRTLTAGQVSEVPQDAAPDTPHFTVNGEGTLTAIGASWTIARQSFFIDDTTLISGNPQIGDIVSVSGHIRDDGTLVADVITRWGTSPDNSFSITGVVEEINETAWFIGRQTIAIAAETTIAGDIRSGDLVSVRGILANGNPVAKSINLIGGSEPFQFSGPVNHMGADMWIIAGIPIQVTNETTLPANIGSGDIVSVVGRIDGENWLATSIAAITPPNATFEISGIADSIDPWSVNGIAFGTGRWTIIDGVIEPGDAIRVRGTIAPDGSWVATIIERQLPLNTDDVIIRFIGILRGRDPWSVNGLPLLVDENSVIAPGLEVGDQVWITAVVSEDGRWRTISIELADSAACLTFAARIVESDGATIRLQDGRTFDIEAFKAVEGELLPGTTISITLCTASDGRVTVVTILVISNLPPPTTPTPTATPAPGDTVTLGCFEITFLGTAPAAAGGSSWRYLVTELPCAQDLSNWVLALPACTAVADATPLPWELVNPDPNHGISGIKWEVEEGFASGEFTVILTGDLTVGVTDVGVKGPDVTLGTIGGPICANPTPSPSPTATVTATMTATITLTPTATTTPTLAPPIADEKVTICHIPPGNPDNAKTLTIGASAVSAHLAHGDTLGPCP